MTTVYLGVSPQEAVGERHAQVEADRLEDVDLHPNERAAVVGVVADVEEVFDQRRTPLL